MKHMHFIAITFKRYGNLAIITLLPNCFEYTLCSWIHPHSWKSLVCLQRQEQRMDTTPFSMTSRTLNFILVFQHIILNRPVRQIEMRFITEVVNVSVVICTEMLVDFIINVRRQWLSQIDTHHSSQMQCPI